MKKVVVASLLACALFAMAVRPAFAQAAGQIELSAAESAAYNAATTQTDPKAKAAALESFLTTYPQSAVKVYVLQDLMLTYASIDPGKTIDAADRLLQADPNNLRGLFVETFYRKAKADNLTDPDPKKAAALKQPTLDDAAGFAQKGLVATQPKDMKPEDFKTLQASAFPVFYSAIGTAALNKGDTPTAIDAFKKELASVPLAQTQAPGLQLQDTYFLGLAYLQSTPPDYLDCAFYVARFVAYAPAALKTQYAPTAAYCYKKYHGKPDGYDTAVVPVATANLTPPATYASSITPAPTMADIINQLLASTPDPATLAVSDREFVLANGTPEQAAKVWDPVKGKSVEIPDAVVIEASPTVMKVAISDDAVQSKTADFTFNMAPPEEEPRAVTVAQKAAAKKKADALAAAMVPGGKVTLTGTYDSFAPNPIMITMTGGEIVLPKAAPTKAAPAPAHRPAPHK